MSLEKIWDRYSVANSENNNMKFFCVLAFLACLVAVVLSQNKPVSDNHCPLACPRNYAPVCGMRQEKGGWKKEIFPNECEMQDENECHQGNYILCPDA